MKVIGLIASKGGVGKSTIAAHIAVCAARAGKTVAAIDLDPQRSLAQWGERRKAEDVTVTDARIQELASMIAKAKAQGADLVVVDSAGRNDTVAAQLAALSDVVLVPVRPGIYDLEASASTASMLRNAKAKRAVFVLNACPPVGNRAAESRSALSALLKVCPVQIGNRVDFSDALADGRSVFELAPKSKAASEITALYGWLIKV
jgi:chromosome partitioning protein